MDVSKFRKGQRMRYLLTAIIAAIIASGGTLYYLSTRVPEIDSALKERRLKENAEMTSSSLKNKLSAFEEDIQNFSDVLSSDRAFTLRLIVERDRTAPEVKGITEKYLPLLRLDYLKITDTRDRELSSAGPEIDTVHSEPDEPGRVYLREVSADSERVLAFEYSVPVDISGKKLLCRGGRILDSAFLSGILPPSAGGIVKKDSVVITSREVSTISELRDNSIVIDNTTHPALSLELQDFQSLDFIICLWEQDEFNLSEFLFR